MLNPHHGLLLPPVEQQYVNFVDPKGIRNLEGPDDPKIRFFKTIKEIETRLADPAVILNSFIISNTPVREVGWWDKVMTREEFEKWNVLFQKDDKDGYIKKLLQTVTFV